jgi:hypothetical protein
MNIREDIIKHYLDVGFEHTDTSNPKILRFNNKFSIQFVFLCDSCIDLRESWRSLHQSLLEDYRTSTGPRYVEWNYYAIFVVTEVSSDEELDTLRNEIQLETSFSRKYVLAAPELDDLPPGMINTKQLKGKTVSYQNFMNQWEMTLGSELLELLLKGSKATIKKRLLNFIEDHLND